jgi:hypothetical protein
MNGKYIFKDFTTESGLMEFLNGQSIPPHHIMSIMFNSMNMRFYLVYFIDSAE